MRVFDVIESRHLDELPVGSVVGQDMDDHSQMVVFYRATNFSGEIDWYAGDEVVSLHPTTTRYTVLWLPTGYTIFRLPTDGPVPAKLNDPEKTRMELTLGRVADELGCTRDELDMWKARSVVRQRDAACKRTAELLSVLAGIHRLTYADGSGTEYEHDCRYDPEPTCPACWADAIRKVLES